MNVYSKILEMSNGRVNTFARDAVYAEFRPRDARAIDYGDWVDRLPHQRPPRIDEIGRRP